MLSSMAWNLERYSSKNEITLSVYLTDLKRKAIPKWNFYKPVNLRSFIALITLF